MTLPFAPPKIQSEGINWKAVVCWGIILGLIAYGAYQYREPITAFFMKPNVDFSSLMNNLTLDNILVFLQKYGVLISCGAAGFTFLYGLYQKTQANKAALELLKTQQTANTEITTAYDTAEQYRQQAEKYQTQYEAIAKNNTQEALLEAQNLVTTKTQAMERMQLEHQTTVATLQNEIDRLKIKTIEKVVVK